MSTSLPTRFLFAMALFGGVAVSLAGAQQAINPARGRIPAGFQRLDNSFWEGPWVLTSGNAGEPVLRWHNDDLRRRTMRRPVPFHLDDGTIGTLRVYAAPCLTAACGGPRDDCGCFDNESYWIDVLDSSGHVVAHLHLWAAYGVFDVVPIDLVGGPGDELMIVRRPQHASPPHGPDLKIWTINAGRATDLLSREGRAKEFDVAGYIGTLETAVPCARWQTRLLVDVASEKPRPITLQADFAAHGEPGLDCRLSAEGTKQVASLKRERQLHFENGHYRWR